MKKFVIMCAFALLFVACGGGGGGGGSSAAPVEVVADPLSIDTLAFLEAKIDTPYTQTLSVSGGEEGNYAFEIDAGSLDQLPASLSLNANTGEISGTPLVGDDGIYNFTVKVTRGSESKTKAFAIRVKKILAIGTPVLPTAEAGQAFIFQLRTDGGFSATNWAVDPSTQDQLPVGLTLSDSGLVSGTPIAGVYGNFFVRFSVSDGGSTVFRDLTFVIEPPVLKIDSTNLPLAQDGAPYAAPALRASGGSGNYQWALSPQSSAAIPNGLTLSAAGVLSGTPGAGTGGVYALLIQVTSDTAVTEREFILQIGNPPLSIATTLLLEAEAAEAYSMTLQAAGGTAPYAWALSPTSGDLPSGLTFSSAGVISGNLAPASEGSYDIEVRLEDSLSAATLKTLTLMVREADPLDAKLVFSQSEINHFLTRTQFGVTEAAKQDVQNAASMADYIDQMLSRTATPSVIDAAKAEAINDIDFPSRTELARYWETLLLRSDAPFQETMALFWHDHFAASTSVLGSTNLYYTIEHISTIRNASLGSFSDLLFDISTDKQMLVFLDGRLSTKGRPNENYAREFWELFTLGVDNGYTQEDIEIAARVFTGWRQSFNGTQNEMVFDPSRHDENDKTLFGKTITGRTGADGVNEYRDLIELTLEERPVAEFIVHKLWEYFAYRNPSQEIIDGLAKTFRDNNYELKPVLRQIFLSNAFYATDGVQPRAKSPIEFAIGLMRSSQLEVRINLLDSFLNLAGHRPSDPPSVSGWPSDEQWLSADAAIQRANFAALVRNERTHQTSLDQSVESLLPKIPFPSASEVVDHMAGLMNLNLTAAQRTTYINYLNTTTSGAVLNFDTRETQHLDERVRGLLNIMAQNPRYNFR